MRMLYIQSNEVDNECDWNQQGMKNKQSNDNKLKRESTFACLLAMNT